MSPIETLVEEFTRRLAALLEMRALERTRLAVEKAFGSRSPKLAAARPGGRPRKKAPMQLCPVPGCKNPAAPVFGMVCAEHKGVAKAKIRKYREARRAAKLGAKTPKAIPAKSTKKVPTIARRTKKSPKPARKGAVAKKPTARGKTPAKVPQPAGVPAIAAAA